MQIPLAAMMLAGLFAAGCVQAVAPYAGPEKLPIIDSHGHLNGDISAETLIALMNRSGVNRMVLMARYFTSAYDAGSGSDEQALDYSRRYLGRFIPFVAGQRGSLGQRNRSRWLKPDGVAEKLLLEAEQKLRSAEFYGLGEFIIRHYDYEAHGQGGGEVDIPVDTPLMRRFAVLAEKFRVPLLLHAEGEPEVVNGMRSLLEYNPKAKVIWAHNCGRSSTEIIGQMLTRYTNLICDLGGMLNASFAGYGRYWPRATQWMHLIEDGSGQLYPEMKSLYERFPDRFLIGTDPAHTPALAHYENRIHRFRQLLSNLGPETAQRLAFKNAEALFRR